jgi:hypothetical protein
VSAGFAKTLAPLLLEDPQLWTASFAVHDAQDAGVGHIRRTSDYVAGIFFDEQYLIESHFRSTFTGLTVNLDDGAGCDSDLMAAGLNNRVHGRSSIES